MERRDDSLDLSSVEEMKVSSPEHSGAVRYVRLPSVRLTALRAPLPENSNDFAMLCAQVYAERCHRGSFVNLQQCRASSQPAGALQGRSVRFGGRPARARQHAEACEASGERSIACGARAASRTRFT